MSPLEIETLLWVMDVKKAFDACEKNQNGLIIFYEDLVESPLETVEKVFNHLKLEMREEVISFLGETTGKLPASKHKRSEIYMDSYFSVFRDSKASRDKWKQAMPKEDQTKVLEIVAQHGILAEGQKRGCWD